MKLEKRRAIAMLIAALVGSLCGGVTAAAAPPNAPAAGFAPAPQEASSAASLGDHAPISLDLKGLDVLDVLKLLSQKSNLSFVAGRNVTGRVTLFVKDVPLWDAFELIVAANDLAYERQGNLINVMTGRDYELLYGEKFQDPKTVKTVSLKFAKAASLATVLNQVKSNVGRVIVDEPSNTIILLDLPAKVEQMHALITTLDVATATRIWELQYAKAKDLQDKVHEMLTPNVGSVRIDERTNTVIATDLPAVIERLDAMLRAFDTKTRQVLIEAKIIQVTLSDSHTSGIDWSAVLGALDSTTRVNFDNLGDILGGAAKGWTLKYSAGSFALTALMEALQTSGKTDIISSPSIAVTDGQEAKILIGTKEAYVTSTVVTPGGSTPTTTAEQVTFVDVGVNLTVTPTIKADGFVQLKIHPEVSSVNRTIKSAQGNEIPVVKTSSADTNVLLKSGTTVIIGGLMEDKIDTTMDKLPLLGDVPLVKHAFRDSKHTVTKAETVIFLTPYVISGDEQIMQMAEARAKAPAAAERLRVSALAPPAGDGSSLPAAYRDAVQRQLARILEGAYRGLGNARSSLVLTFRVAKNGALLDAPVVENADDPVVRRRTVDAVQAAAPFPPFPAGSPLHDAQFRVAIEYAPESAIMTDTQRGDHP